MSTTALTPDQLQQVEQDLSADQSDPAAIWAALSLMGDQYAAAAFQGLTNPQSFYGQVIQNSNTVSGVSSSDIGTIENNVVDGYVADLEKATLNPDGMISLPNTTAIESNYYTAVTNAGVPDPTAAIDLCVAKLCQAGLLGGQNWYNGFFGLGLNLDPTRFGQPSTDLNNISLSQAEFHFITTAGLTALTEGVNAVTPTPLNAGEAAMLAAAEALATNPTLLNGGDLTDPTLNTNADKALFADMQVLDGAISAGEIGGAAPMDGSVNALAGGAVKESLAEILVQHAGDQVAAGNNADTGLFSASTPSVLSVDLNPADWTTTYAQAQPTILGVQPLLDAVSNNLLGAGASTAWVDNYLSQNSPSLIEAALSSGATLDGTQAAPSYKSSNADAVLIGQNDSTINAGDGNNLIIGGENVTAGNGNNIIVGTGAGNETINVGSAAPHHVGTARTTICMVPFHASPDLATVRSSL